MVLSESAGHLLNELKELGHNYANVNEVFTKSRIESDEVGVILKWLPSVYNEHVGSADQLVRSLISATSPYNANVLIDLFESATLNKSLKSSIAHVLSYSPTHDISKWMIYQLSNEPYSFEKASLIAGILEKKYMSQAEGA